MKYKIVVLGANGLTGRLVVEQLLKADSLLRREDGSRGWAVAGRIHKRIEETLQTLEVEDIEIFHADLEDPTSLKDLANRAEVILNLAGPYTPHAEKLISACVDAKTSYVDLAGEIPLLRRVIHRFDDAAKTAGIQIVQMCGWEAFPADVATFMASKKVQDSPATDVTLTIQIENQFKGMLPLNQMVSAGTLASIVQMLEDPEADLIGLEESLTSSTASKDKQIKIESFEFDGKIYGPVVPVPYLNPPVIRRTEFLLSRESGIPYKPTAYREGIEVGSSESPSALFIKAMAAVSSYVQAVVGQITLLPLALRKPMAQGLKKLLPASASGPSGAHLRDWTWTVAAHAKSEKGQLASWGLKGLGHPGYTSTAAMIVETGLHIALSQSSHRGCITPALAMKENFENFYVEDLKAL